MTARHRVRRATRPLGRAVASGVASFLLLVAAFLVGPLPAQAEDATLLRLAQLQSELPSVEIVVAPVADPRKPVITAKLDYGEVLPYRAVEPGDYLVTMRPAGSTEPPKVSRTVLVQPGTAYTVASVRHTVTADDLGVFTDDLTAPAPGKTRLRVINATSPAPQLDVRDGSDQPVALALPNAQSSPYRDVTPGTTHWTVAPPSAPPTPVSFGVSPNQVASVVLLNGDGGPHASVVVDAGGPAVVPTGAVHAGFGGMAGPRPGEAISSVVLVVLATVAGAASVRLARRAE